MSRSSLDSTSTSSVTISSTSNSINYTNSSANSTASAANNAAFLTNNDSTEPGVGGVPNRFLGITPAYLWQTHLQQMPFMMVCSPPWNAIYYNALSMFSSHISHTQTHSHRYIIFLYYIYLILCQLLQDIAEYQMSLSCEVEARLKAKCIKLADAFVDDIGRFL